MSVAVLLLTGLFLPLYPLSVLFNWLLNRLPNARMRAALLVVWPLTGLGFLSLVEPPVPDWILPWAVASAALYGLRALAMRDVLGWTGYLATSAWALLWVAAAAERSVAQLALYALGFSLPLLLLASLSAGLEQRFGAAYTGIYGGLAESLPRFSGVLVAVVLAAVGTPVFPAFLVMLTIIVASLPASPGIAVAVLVTWSFWTWAGIRLLQGLIVGTPGEETRDDLGAGMTWGYAGVLAVFVVAGMLLVGGRL